MILSFQFIVERVEVAKYCSRDQMDILQMMFVDTLPLSLSQGNMNGERVISGGISKGTSGDFVRGRIGREGRVFQFISLDMSLLLE